MILSMYVIRIMGEFCMKTNVGFTGLSIPGGGMIAVCDLQGGSIKKTKSFQ